MCHVYFAFAYLFCFIEHYLSGWYPFSWAGRVSHGFRLLVLLLWSLVPSTLTVSLNGHLSRRRIKMNVLHF